MSEPTWEGQPNTCKCGAVKDPENPSCSECMDKHMLCCLECEGAGCKECEGTGQAGMEGEGEK